MSVPNIVAPRQHRLDKFHVLSRDPVEGVLRADGRDADGCDRRGQEKPPRKTRNRFVLNCIAHLLPAWPP